MGALERARDDLGTLETVVDGAGGGTFFFFAVAAVSAMYLIVRHVSLLLFPYLPPQVLNILRVGRRY